jgi:hypothetical protein
LSNTPASKQVIVRLEPVPEESARDGGNQEGRGAKGPEGVKEPEEAKTAAEAKTPTEGKTPDPDVGWTGTGQ